ncbi:MAG: NADPH-dependent assimilatory sulfite reductase hemoprotein subunit [Gammaproteobacteria bacterium]
MSINSNNSKPNNSASGGGASGAPSPVEKIKDRSGYLRGGIAAGLADDLTGGIAEDDQSLIKFHGIYQQDDRDVRAERAARKLEPDYSFMIRLRVPGGLLTAAQWLAVDAVAGELTTAGSIRLTTRQTLQFHGVPKQNLRPALKSCARRLLDSIAACGDVNRNVMCSPHPGMSPVHAKAHRAAQHISEFLLPNTRAYYEIWLGEEKIAAAPPPFKPPEPLYGKHYLPRKFKIAVAVPPSNDVDAYSQDIGFVAVARNGKLRGFNVLAGGGLGMTHGDRRTYPRLGEALGFCAPSQAAEVAWHIAALQRDYGDRSDRKQARFKYTAARLGLDFIRAELAQRLGFVLPPAEQTKFTRRSDILGWQQQPGGLRDLTLYAENGRIKGALREALRETAALGCCDFLMTPNQNLMLVGIAKNDCARVEKVFARRGVGVDFSAMSGLRQNAMACVAFPTCPLAFAEAERYLPSLLDKLETALAKHGLQKDAISIRMTGCPNGCARPYLGEIGLVGKSPGRYNLYLGASPVGARLSAFAGQNMNESEILAALSPLFGEYAECREDGEGFGDFLVRTGKARAPSNAADFHP